jgi:predicted AlkP superfamily phosphohydrolase/phosphomutase
VDGADWDYLNALAAAGRVPNWSRLSKEGYGATLESFVPILSPLVWTTQATGVGPDVHRVLDFQEVDRETGVLVPVSGASRKVPAVWSIASHLGRRVGVVRFWATHPAEKVKGFFLSDRLDPGTSRAPSPGVAFPASLDEAVTRVLERDGRVSIEDLQEYLNVPDQEIRAALASRAEEPNLVSSLGKLVASTRVTHRLARELYDRERPDFLAVYYQGTDEVGHLFAPYAPPQLACTDAADFERFRRVPEVYFAMFDALLGQWMRRAKEDKATLILTSDHGFRWGADRPCGKASTEGATAALWHRLEGVFLAWGEGVPALRAQRRATAFDVAPTFLALMDLPPDRRMRGSVIPLRPSLSAKAAEDLFPKVAVETVAATAIDREQANEYARRLLALGYLSGADAAAQGVPAKASAGLTKGGWNNLGVYLRFTAQDDAAARKAWEESLALDPRYASPLLNIATLEKDRGRFAEAGRWLLKAIAAGQHDAEHTVARWAGEFERRRPGAGLALLAGVHSAYRGNEAFARQYALLLARNRRCREGKEVIKPLEGSNQSETLNVAAVIEGCLDRPDRVRLLLQRSLEIDPSQPRVRDAIAALPP